jgi:aminomethyltransferase
MSCNGSTSRSGRLGDFNGPGLVVSRTGYTGELGYSSLHPRDAVTLFDALMEAGKPSGLTPARAGAWTCFGSKAGLVFFGYDFNDQTDPFEPGSGLRFRCGRTKLVGRSAHAPAKQGARHALVGLDVEDNEIAQHGNGVYRGPRKSAW